MMKFNWLNRKKSPETAPDAKSAGTDGPAVRNRRGGRRLNSLRLELRCRGKLLISVSAAELADVTTIGSAPDNDWVLPETSGRDGAHIARLTRTVAGLKLTACDGKKLYLRGEPLAECMLRKKDRVAIGDAELFVKPLPRRSPNACDDHRLEVLEGANKGQMIHLKSSPFRIGSAPDNDLVLDSDVVSAHHAELRVAANGECWIRDLHSSNGTFVNGERLGHQERMLMDSDEVSVAYFDYHFLDRSVIHTRTHFGKKLLIMGLTVVLVLFGFGIFYLSEPKAETVINAVDYHLFRNQFDAAERVLRKLPESRGFLRYEKQYRDYLSQIPYYRKIYAATLQLRDQLKESQWHAASESYGALELNNPQAWNPADPNTEPRQKELAHAKEMLDLLLAIYSLDTSPNASLAVLQENWRQMAPWRQRVPGLMKSDPDYLQPLLRQLQERLVQQERNVTILAEIDRHLTALAEHPDAAKLTEFLKHIEQQRQNVTGVVRIYIRELTFLLGLIQQNMKELEHNDQAVFDLRMGDLKPVSLIAPDDCMKIPQLYRMRRRLEERLQAQLRTREHWRGLQRQLGRYDLLPGKIPEEVRLFSDEQRIETILELAELRKDPSGKIPKDYETMFGERYFYEVLQQSVHTTVNLYASDLIPDMKTIPKCVLLKDLYRGVNEALLWFALPQNEWLLHGRMKEVRDYYRQLMGTRPKVLQCFENIASRHRDDRCYFLARAGYFYFAPLGPEMPEKMLAFGAEWRKFRMKQQELLDAYDPMKPGSTLRVRSRIVEIGIPGDPVFNWMRHLK